MMKAIGLFPNSRTGTAAALNANNVVVVCRLHQLNTFKEEPNEPKAYEEI